VAGQGRALVQWAEGQGAAPAAVLYRDDEPAAGAAEAAATALARAGHAVERVAYRPGARPGAAEVAAARAADAERLFFFGTGQELLALLSALDEAAWSPQLLAPGPLVADGLGALPDDLGARLRVAFPTLPIDHSAEALKLRHELATAAGVEEGQDAAQLAALAAAELLVEGLKRAGRDLAREKLVTVLEGLYEFQTGLTRPLTYSPNQRVGAAGAYLLTVDAAERSFSAPEWVAVDD
jgi:ABC-type branched-subunit amino acid transport system substrate-binding protein